MKPGPEQKSSVAIAILVLLFGCQTPEHPAPAPSPSPSSPSLDANPNAGDTSLSDISHPDPSNRPEKALRAALQATSFILDSPDTYRLQILITTYECADCPPDISYRVDAEYFYPASAIKTLGSLAALRLVVSTPLALDSLLFFDGQEDENLAFHIERTQVVSSNHTFNRLYDLVGHQYLHEFSRGLGLKSVRLHHRMFSRGDLEAERRSPSIAFCPGAGPDCEPAPLYQERISTLAVPVDGIDGLKVGASYLDLEGTLVEQAMDFSTKNYLSLADHQRLNVLIFEEPELVGLSAPHLEMIRDLMRRDPAGEPGFDEGARRRFKPMWPGLAAVLGEDFEYANKGGRAYGFHIENARIKANNRVVYVSAVLYVNKNQRLNDDTYEYDEISFPFFEELGKFVADVYLSP